MLSVSPEIAGFSPQKDGFHVHEQVQFTSQCNRKHPLDSAMSPKNQQFLVSSP